MGHLDDVEAIRQLHAWYCHLVDALEIEAWVECFTDDGVLELDGRRTVGRDALRVFGKGLEAMYSANPLRHVVVNVVIDVDGDAATSQSYLMITANRGRPELTTSGGYRDRLARVDGRWRFAERVMTSDRAPATG